MSSALQIQENTGHPLSQTLFWVLPPPRPKRQKARIHHQPIIFHSLLELQGLIPGTLTLTLILTFRSQGRGSVITYGEGVRVGLVEMGRDVPNLLVVVLEARHLPIQLRLRVLNIPEPISIFTLTTRDRIPKGSTLYLQMETLEANNNNRPRSIEVKRLDNQDLALMLTPHLEPQEVSELRDADVQSGGGGEARHDRVRDELEQPPQLKEPHPHQHPLHTRNKSQRLSLPHASVLQVSAQVRRPFMCSQPTV
jgi:hypothetical protein